jgi:glyoxylase-like metal-dependent hydrolase (beta-lactamase superfamily II)
MTAAAWAGGAFGERARCVLAPNAGTMTLDGTNTWVLREPGATRSVVVDPGPLDAGHLDAVAACAGEVSVVLLTQRRRGTSPSGWAAVCGPSTPSSGSGRRG